MIVENHGLIYRVGFDLDAIQKVTYSLVLVGEVDLAFKVLTNTFCTPEQATALIEDVSKQLTEEPTT
jgi:hypothetical protein